MENEVLGSWIDNGLIFGLVFVCMAGVCLAADAPQARVNAIDVNAVERVFGLSE